MATILIVDDRRINRQYLAAILEDTGHRLQEATDGAEALDVVRSERPDLVISDILMPTMDGYELLRQLRGDPAISQTPVIFYTAHYHEKESLALALAWGVAGVLIKGCEPEVVLRAVQAALRQEAPAPNPPAAEEFDREHMRLLTDKLSQKAEELRRANERLTALIDLGLELGSERDPGQALQLFCHAAREIFGAKYAMAGILAGEGGALRYFFTSGMDAATAARLGSPDPWRGVPGTVLRESRGLRLHNPSGDPAAVDFPSSYPPFHSWLGAPIASAGRAYGWLCLLDKVGAEGFSDEDERLAGILAAQVGWIYETSSLYADMRRHAGELELEVAERKRAEEALRASEAQSRLLLASTAEAIYGIDIRGLCTFCNSACLRLLGYAEPHQLLGKHMHALIHHTRADGTPYPEDECRIFQAFRQGGGAHVEDEVLWRADGSCFPAEYWSFPIRHEEKIVGSVVTFLDITERRRLEEQFRQAQNRLSHVVVSSPSVLFTLPIVAGQMQGIDWTSDNLPEVLGYSTEAALGQDWWLGNVHPEDRDRVIEQFQADLLNQERSTYEYRFRHGDGSYRWTRCEMRMMRDAGGRPVEVVGSWSDVTERKSLEDQFRQAQKMEAVGQLAGGVAHDFNNLLQVIVGYGDLLLGTLRPDDPSRELVGEMTRAGERAAGLTRQLLAFSRQSVLAPKVLVLNSVIIDLERMLRRVIGEDIDLGTDLQPGLGRVKADPGQIEQVVMNLAVNARDAMPHGGKLTIETHDASLDEEYARMHPGVRPGPYVLLAVSDTGHGMTPEVKARVFEPFFTTKEKGKGTGLGLATVFGVVQQAGGHVAVYSEPGMGTSFKVYLPRIDAAAPPTTSLPGAQPTPKGTETVLLVEDEDAVRTLTRIVLQGAGYRVLEASDGGEALAVAGRHEGPIHLLLSDVVMPVLGGRELAERLLALHPEIKVLFQSGYTDDAVVRHGVLQEAVHFLQKPYTPSSLAKKVREVLDWPG